MEAASPLPLSAAGVSGSLCCHRQERGWVVCAAAPRPLQQPALPLRERDDHTRDRGKPEDRLTVLGPPRVPLALIQGCMDAMRADSARLRRGDVHVRLAAVDGNVHCAVGGSGRRCVGRVGRPARISATSSTSIVRTWSMTPAMACAPSAQYRGAVIGGGSILRAAETIREKIVRTAAYMLEADTADLTIEGGVIRVVGSPGKS